jgi:hypothetical protein
LFSRTDSVEIIRAGHAQQMDDLYAQVAWLTKNWP